MKAKKSVTKRNLGKFSKVNTHKRRGKEKARQELIRALESTKVSFDGCVIKDVRDGERRHAAGPRINEKRVIGVFCGSSSGFGFVTPEAESLGRDIFIPEGRSLGAISGDYVECVYRSYRSYLGEDKTEGRVTKIISYGRETVTGTLVLEPSYMRGRHRVAQRYYLIPDDAKLGIRPTVTDTAGAVPGDKVAVRLNRGTGTGYSPLCDVISVFGDALSRGANYEAILHESEVPTEFSEDELAAAELAASMPLSDEGRVRYSDVVFTIDGEGAKDLDDAVSLRRVRGGWRLGVHIADVSAYVTEKSVLDRCVMKRGTSIYFTDKVIPMLPPAISNGACSLHPGGDKYALSAIVNLDSDGAIKNLRLEPSIINSRVRGVYSEVNRIFNGDRDKELIDKYQEVIPSLMRMRELYLLLKKRSDNRGALELLIPEAEILLDVNGEPIDIVKRSRGVAERMIEQFMLVANEAVATFLNSEQIPAIYRVHDRPAEDKMRDFITFAHNLGFDTEYISLDKCEPRDFSRLLAEAEDRGVLAQVSYTMLRSMAKAEYSEIAREHFGLAIHRYCHFTSPIRRLSDLATHRVIHRVLLEGKRRESYASYARRAARAATETELRAIAVERRIENLYKTVYMSKYIGEEFDATVSSVTTFGIFAELDNTCEGLIPMSMLPGMFVFDEKNMCIRSGNMFFRVGDRIRIRHEESDIPRGKLRFSLVV